MPCRTADCSFVSTATHGSRRRHRQPAVAQRHAVGGGVGGGPDRGRRSPASTTARSAPAADGDRGRANRGGRRGEESRYPNRGRSRNRSEITHHLRLNGGRNGAVARSDPNRSGPRDRTEIPSNPNWIGGHPKLRTLGRVTREPLAFDRRWSALSFWIMSSVSCFIAPAWASSPTACRSACISEP